jgi:general secretion pathway protein J
VVKLNNLNTAANSKSIGFTLVEMLVALAIGAGISVMSYRALDAMIRSEARVSVIIEQVDSLDRVWQFFSIDLMNAVDRDAVINKRKAMTGVFGDRLAQSKAIRLNEDQYLLRFVRGGRENILDLTRSSLYEVAYSLTQENDVQGQTLWRDRLQVNIDELITDVPRKKQRLLDGIKSLQFEYLPRTFTQLESSAWITGWPPDDSVQENNNGLPAAVKITINTFSLGEVARIFALTVDDAKN